MTSSEHPAPHVADRPLPKLKPVRQFLAGDRTPMWFTLFMLLAGAGGTYVLAPRVNAQFEEQKIRSDFVIRNYGDLRAKMEDLYGTFTVATQKQAAGEDLRAEVTKLQEQIARISAQNLSLMPMFSTEGGPKAIAELHAAMNGLLQVIFAHAGKSTETPEEVAAYTKETQAAMQKLVVPLLELYVRIADVGRLNPTEKNRQLAK